MHHLNAQVIFFVHHDAERFARFDQHGSRTRTFGQLAADHLTFDQQLSVERR